MKKKWIIAIIAAIVLILGLILALVILRPQDPTPEEQTTAPTAVVEDFAQVDWDQLP